MIRDEDKAELHLYSRQRGHWQALILLIVGCVATYLAARQIKFQVENDSRLEFDFICKEIQNKIKDRLHAHEQILRSGAAFFDRAGIVTRNEWHRFVALQRMDQYLPGIQGLGFSALVPRDALAGHISQIRSEGFPEYRVRPEGDREYYAAIVYLEPFTNRNLRAFGFDMLSEPVRRTAMERARDEDAAALSGKVTLVQETDQDIQAGTLMYMPVYRADKPKETTAQRRAALIGWVYSPYRMNDLMQGILGGWGFAGQKRIRLEVYDGNSMDSGALLYDSQPSAKLRGAAPSGLTFENVLISAGRRWTLKFTRSDSHSPSSDYSKVWLIACSGGVTSLLLSGLFFSVLNTRYKAWALAGQLTSELSESEKKYRSLLDDMLEGFAYCRMVFDQENRPVNFIYLKVNRAFERLTGLRDVVGKKVTDLIPGVKETHPELLELYGRVVQTGRPEKFDIHFKPFGRWFSISATQSDNGCFAAIFEDITGRKQAEEALRLAMQQAEQHLAEVAAIMDAVPALVFVALDVECRQMSGNRISRELLGLPQFGQYLMPLASERSRPHYRMMKEGREIPAEELPVQQAAHGKEIRDFELDLVFDSGETRNIRGDAVPLLDAEGRIFGAVGAFADVTERKRLEEKEKADFLTRQLHKSESLARMAGAVAHHFNNQLQVVMMNLDFVLRGCYQGETPAENLGDALKAARKAAEVSSSMLLYLGQTNARHEPIDLCECLNQRFMDIKASMPDGVEFVDNLPAQGPVVDASASQIQQVLAQLVTNAWEARAGSPISIALSVRIVSSSAISARNRFPINQTLRDGNFACIEVSDTGCGIPPGDVEKIFDPFFSSKFTGRGLGLSVVLGIVRAHDGVITVESSPGGGSIFRVYLPALVKAPPRNEVDLAGAFPRQGGEGTVLVADDEPSLLAAVASAVAALGFKVLKADDGAAAVDLFRQHRADIRLFICDLSMPRMDGWDALTAIRRIEPGVPVILASGYSESLVMNGDHEEMPQAFLAKPYDHEQLRDAIFRVLKFSAGSAS